MKYLYRSFLYFLFVVIRILYCFTPDQSSFDAYGVKLAANDILLVESLASDSSFFIRFSPYNYSLSCTIPYNNSNEYIYSVAVHSSATYNDPIRFVFIGINMDTDIPFVGSLTYNGITGPAFVDAVNSSVKAKFPCNGWNTDNYHIHQLQQFVNDDLEDTNNNDFFIVTISSTGEFAYGFTNSFLIIYDLDGNNISSQYGNVTWRDPSFLPRAVDMNKDLLFVIIGYIGDPNIKYSPCSYLINLVNSTIFNILDEWIYSPSSTSWQSSLTNFDAYIYSSKYDMSISFNNDGNEILIGIQIINSILIFNIDKINEKFNLTMSQIFSNGKSIGMGKSVAWLDLNRIIVLVNTYSLNYIWLSSQIFTYNITIYNNFSVLSIFPNIQQTLTSTFSPNLLSFVLTENGKEILLDSSGNYYILLPSSAGSYSDSSSGTYSSSSLCIAGTFTSKEDIFPCQLCPSGSTTNGLAGQSSCIECSNDSFCSLGSAFGDINLSSSILKSFNEIIAYPVSPQSVRFDNILMQNMFVIHDASSSRCLLLSPLFWAIIVIAFGLLIWIIRFILKSYINNPFGKKTQEQMKRFLKKTDLIGEGELVIGGIFSFAILVLVIFAYTFSNSYFHRYPIEEINENADFACDQTLTNAQFSSGLMSIGIPPDPTEEPIFNLLNSQIFTLNIDFINTVFNCTDILVTQIKDKSLPMNINSCNDTLSTTSLSLILPSHDINIQIQLSGIHTIGALRISLQGSSQDMTNETLNAIYTLSQLLFAQTLSMNDQMLTQQVSCSLQITKVINRTYPLEEEGETEFNAIWLPIISGSTYEMFIDENQYIYSTSTSTIISIIISETSYYTLNIQKPITDFSELIFTNLLFTIVCLEIFGLGFLIFKLIIIPFIKWIYNHSCSRRHRHRSSRRPSSIDEIYINDLSLPNISQTRM
ncbi:unnamed protein product [Adineta steineri]|uniref:Tyrosine-protein kinase ephrin type A/B receptor-like domain-containing protein n=1 Tax=Adineta steineri TaxID=433720 RepID=A0A818IGD3_9BILA|nr:unnamed protein product [Adineta steineri]CAF3519270.1 unnamed protein product [Adineta steineri]